MTETFKHYSFDFSAEGPEFLPEPELDSFGEKDQYLSTYFESVEPVDFYRQLFPVGTFERQGHPEDHRGNAIAVVIEKNKAGNNSGRKVIITDGLEQLPELLKNEFVVLSPISYFGRSRFASNALWLHAMTLDIDYVSLPKLQNIVNWFDSLEIIPTPTYIVNSGHGVHLYYVFEQPIPMYRQTQTQLKKLKTALIKGIWTKYTSDHPERIETLGMVQGFRMVGSTIKQGTYKLKAYEVGDKVTLDYLNEFVGSEDRAVIKEAGTKYTLEEAKELFPEWYEQRIVQGEKAGKWHIKRDLYDWFLNLLKSGSGKVGHRYFCIMCLAVYASKCDVPYEELEADALALQPVLSSLDDRQPFTIEETHKALEAYYHDYDRFPRATMERISAIGMPPNKRNYQKTTTHLQGDYWFVPSEPGNPNSERVMAVNDCKTHREFKLQQMKKQGLIKGRPVGSGIKRQQILDYATTHPEANHSEIARVLGVSRSTVVKWLRTASQEDTQR